MLGLPAAEARPKNGGAPARRAMRRWAWRLFRSEWRQQLLIVALVVVAVGATVLGATVATNTPPAANAGFGTAQDLVNFQGRHPETTCPARCAEAPVRKCRSHREPDPDRPRLHRHLRPARPGSSRSLRAAHARPRSPAASRPDRARWPLPRAWRPTSGSGSETFGT